MGDTKSLASGIYEVSLQFLGGGISDRVYQRMQIAVLRFQLFEEASDVFVFGDVAHIAFGARKRQDEILRFLLEALILIRNGKLHAGGMQSLSDRPGDRAFVRNSEDNGVLALQISRHSVSLRK